MKKLFTLTFLASSAFLTTSLLSQAIASPEIASRTVQANSSTTPQQTLTTQNSRPEYTGIVKQVDDIADQITVRILNSEDDSLGSGVLIAENNNTYYVATAKHVIDEDKDNLVDRDYQIVTPDGVTHQIDKTKGIVSEAYDLAILSFTSEQIYEVATLGNYRVGQNSNQAVFLSGFPLSDNNPLPSRIITGGFAQKEEEVEFATKDSTQLAQSVPVNSQELIYTNISHGGMSGGAVLDTEGRLVGINTGAENEIYFAESGNYAEFGLGFSIGISTQELIGFVSTQTNFKREWLKGDENKESTPLTSGSKRQSIENQLWVATKPNNTANSTAWMNYGNQLWRYKKYSEAIVAFEQVIALNDPQFELDKAYYAMGLAHAYQKEYQKAAKAFTEAAEIQPLPYFYWRRLGLCYFHLGLYKQAINTYKQAIIRNKQDFTLYVEKGNALRENEQNLEAIEIYNQAAELNPQHPWIHTNRGLALENLGKYEEAFSSYDKAIEINPYDQYAWTQRGLALANLGKYEEALSSYDKALKVHPEDQSTWTNNGIAHRVIGLWTSRGIALKNLGRHEEALFSYEKALEFKPDDQHAWANRGIALSNLERYEEAISSYDKAIEFKPDFHPAWTNRGVDLTNLERYEEAISSYDKAIEFKPDYYIAWYNRGISLENLGKYEEAISSYDKALQFKPDYYIAWTNRGIALENLGRYEEAISSYDEALQFKPNFYQSWFSRGIALENLGRYEEAISSCDKAIEFKPDYYEAWYNRGLTLKNLGRHEEAISSYDKALQFKPDFYLAWINHGIALKNLSRHEEAISSYDKALEFKPDSHLAWYNRGVVMINLEKYAEAEKNWTKAAELAQQQNDHRTYQQIQPSLMKLRQLINEHKQ